MSYIKFQDDPIAQRFNNSFANLCAGDPTKKVLKLLDRCFKVFNNGKSEASFCDLEKFLYPVDGSQSIDFEVCGGAPGETLVIYDNDLDSILPTYQANVTTPVNYPNSVNPLEYFPAIPAGTSSSPAYYLLQNDRNYARGCLLYIDYPVNDKNGEPVIPAAMSCDITITDYTGSSISYPISQFFSQFSNPETLNATKLINKIEIHNPNLNFSIKVKGLIVYVKSNTDPANCAC